MTNILGANVTIMVKNMQESITFYTDVLGFTLVNNFGGHWADVEAPGIAIGLHPVTPGITIGDNLSLGLRVSNLPEAIEALTSKGVTFRQLDDTQVQLAFFQDPSGNALYLVEMK